MNFTKKDRKVLRQAIRQLLNGNIPNKATGICSNLWDMVNGNTLGECIDVYGIVQEMATTWPNNSKVKGYPIKSKQHPDIAYMEHSFSKTLWEGQQLEERQSLLRHMLRCI